MEFEGMVSNDPEMLKIFEMTSKMADIDCPVLIQGASGTGKELVAQAIHRRSHRSAQPFIAVNCAALPEGLLESELFGHKAGAFTGATGDRKGIFEQADGGSLLLDEISETSVAFQVKLLRVLQESEIRPVGGDRSVKVDVRILSATNADLSLAIEKGKFREDLFYRLNVMVVRLPRLAERVDDVPILARHFLSRAATKVRRRVDGFTDEAVERLLRYSWPGNVRELENMVVSAAYSASTRGDGDMPVVVDVNDFPTLAEKVARSPRKTRLVDVPFYQAREEFERQYIADLLQRTGHNVAAASRLGKISRKSLTTKAERLGLL